MDILPNEFIFANKTLVMKNFFMTLFCFLLATPLMAQNTLPDWALGGFVRPEGVNPVITTSNRSFRCPMRETKILWEESDVFNPAATVKDGKIVVLYRAEDKTAMGIG